MATRRQGSTSSEDSQKSAASQDGDGKKRMDPKRAALMRMETGSITVQDCVLLSKDFAKEQESFVQSVWFLTFVVVEVLTNVIILGVEVDRKCRNNCDESSDQVWELLDHAMTGWCLCEMLVLVLGHGGPKYFCRDCKARKGFHWLRSFDFALVIIRVVDVWILSDGLGLDTGLRRLTVLRIWHLGALANRIKRYPFFGNLNWLIAGFGGSMRSIVMVMGTLVVMTWLTGIVITINAGPAAMSDSDVRMGDAAWTKDIYWGSVPSSMYSLFQAVTLDEWALTLVWPLFEKKPWLVVVFIIFLIVGYLGAVNSVIGCVVDSIIAGAKLDEERKLKDKEERDALISAALGEIIGSSGEQDFDSADKMTRAELHQAFSEPTVMRSLRLLGIFRSDYDLLFTLLDQDLTGRIKKASFFTCCGRLRGPAMSIDLYNLGLDVKRHTSWLDRTDEKMDTMMDTLEGMLTTMYTIDTRIIHDDSDFKDPVRMARQAREHMPAVSVNRSSTISLDQSAVGDRAPSKSSRSASKTARNPSKSIFKKALKFKDNLYDRAQDVDADADEFNPLAPPPPPPLPPHIEKKLAQTQALVGA